MTTTTPLPQTPIPAKAPTTVAAWRGFSAGAWQNGIDVRDFIQRNYTPYAGDAAFLQGATARTSGIWDRITAMFPAERERGVYDVDPSTPSTITSHRPGYIDQPNELIVGLQTDAPLKRAIMPNGGWRMVEDALLTYGYQPDPDGEGNLHQVPQDAQPGRLRRLPAECPRRPALARHHRICRMPTAVAGSSATTAASPCTGSTR